MLYPEALNLKAGELLAKCNIKHPLSYFAEENEDYYSGKYLNGLLSFDFLPDSPLERYHIDCNPEMYPVRALLGDPHLDVFYEASLVTQEFPIPPGVSITPEGFRTLLWLSGASDCYLIATRDCTLGEFLNSLPTLWMPVFLQDGCWNEQEFNSFVDTFKNHAKDLGYKVRAKVCSPDEPTYEVASAVLLGGTKYVLQSDMDITDFMYEGASYEEFDENYKKIAKVLHSTTYKNTKSLPICSVLDCGDAD